MSTTAGGGGVMHCIAGWCQLERCTLTARGGPWGGLAGTLGVDWMGQLGWWSHVKRGSRLPLPLPLFLPPSFLDCSLLRPTNLKPGCRVKVSNIYSRRDFGMVVGMGV